MTAALQTSSARLGLSRALYQMLSLVSDPQRFASVIYKTEHAQVLNKLMLPTTPRGKLTWHCPNAPCTTQYNAKLWQVSHLQETPFPSACQDKQQGNTASPLPIVHLQPLPCQTQVRHLMKPPGHLLQA